MTSGGSGFLRYLTLRKALFPRSVILANGGESLPKQYVLNTLLQPACLAAIYLQL